MYGGNNDFSIFREIIKKVLRTILGKIPMFQSER